jgi:uncharacterized membrane protein
VEVCACSSCLLSWRGQTELGIFCVLRSVCISNHPLIDLFIWRHTHQYVPAYLPLHSFFLVFFIPSFLSCSHFNRGTKVAKPIKIYVRATNTDNAAVYIYIYIYIYIYVCVCVCVCVCVAIHTQMLC